MSTLVHHKDVDGIRRDSAVLKEDKTTALFIWQWESLGTYIL